MMIIQHLVKACYNEIISNIKTFYNLNKKRNIYQAQLNFTRNIQSMKTLKLSKIIVMKHPHLIR